MGLLSLYHHFFLGLDFPIIYCYNETSFENENKVGSDSL